MPRDDLVVANYRRGSAAAWTSANPTLADREIGMETGGTTIKFKIGDGSTAWTSLGYAADHAAWALVTGKPAFAAVATSGSASDLGSGTLPDARLSSDVARRAGGNSFTDTQTFTGLANFNGVLSGVFYDYVKAGGWSLFGAENTGAGDQLEIGGYRASQWQVVRLYTNGTLGLTLDSSQNTTFAGWAKAAAFQVGADQVVGVQGAAVADATDAASTMARLNDLLARLRTHGLIAT